MKIHQHTLSKRLAERKEELAEVEKEFDSVTASLDMDTNIKEALKHKARINALESTIQDYKNKLKNLDKLSTNQQKKNRRKYGENWQEVLRDIYQKRVDYATQQSKEISTNQVNAAYERWKALDENKDKKFSDFADELNRYNSLADSLKQLE